MFKKRQKKTESRINLNDIQVEGDQEEDQQQQREVPKLAISKKINKFTTKKQEIKDHSHKQPLVVKYGLIDKSQVDSKYHANQQAQEKVKQPQSNSLINMYVKKKMQEMTSKANNEHHEKNKETSAEEILSLQRKYLQSQQKLAEYDVKQMQKKLQSLSTNTIKSQIQLRTNYLRNLLENQHERMQYASKKELKTLRQQKQRLQEEYSSKYRQNGRRNYVDKMKFQSMFDS